MTVDYTELRRLAAEAQAQPWDFTDTGKNLAYIAAADPQTVLALLDAAERADRAIGLLRRCGALLADLHVQHSCDCVDQVGACLDEIASLFAEVDRG